jgi:hypothetical protein
MIPFLFYRPTTAVFLRLPNGIIFDVGSHICRRNTRLSSSSARSRDSPTRTWQRSSVCRLRPPQLVFRVPKSCSSHSTSVSVTMGLEKRSNGHEPHRSPASPHGKNIWSPGLCGRAPLPGCAGSQPRERCRWIFEVVPGVGADNQVEGGWRKGKACRFAASQGCLDQVHIWAIPQELSCLCEHRLAFINAIQFGMGQEMGKLFKQQSSSASRIEDAQLALLWACSLLE